jgi:hypothetical protein
MHACLRGRSGGLGAKANLTHLTDMEDVLSIK